MQFHSWSAALAKRVKDTCFKNSLVVLQFSFFASPQAKNGFLARPSLWTAIESVNFKDYAPRKSWVQIPYRPKFFFSGLIFTTAQVEYTLLGGSLSFTSLTAVQIHDFHMFLAVYSSLHGLIWNQHNNQFPVGSLALLLLVFFFQALFSLLLK